MGLFGPSKYDPANQGPQPSLQLHSSSPANKIHRPGDAITGHVAITTPIPITPQAVEISLWGQSQTWIRRSSSSNNSTTYYHYRDHTTLFNFVTNALDKSIELCPGQTYNFPFNFTMPERTGSGGANPGSPTDNKQWTNMPHILPPTFSHGEKGWPDNCAISYGITARLIAPGIGITRLIVRGLGVPDVTEFEPPSCILPVLFSPPNRLPHVINPNMTRSSKNYTLTTSVLAGVSASNMGLRQQMRDIFSSSTPKLDFELAIDLPDLMHCASEFAFRATFKTLTKADSVAQIPPITFKIEKLELRNYAFFRAPRDWAANSMMSGTRSSYRDSTPRSGYRSKDEEDHREDKTSLNALPQSMVVELAEVPGPEKSDMKTMTQAGDCEAWFRGRVPGGLPPSFQSFAITTAYTLKVKMVLEVAGKSFSMSAEGPAARLEER